MCCSATGRAGHRWANVTLVSASHDDADPATPPGGVWSVKVAPMALEVIPEEFVQAASAHADGEGADVLGSPVLATATAAFASARTDEAPRAATRAGQVADGACALGGSVTSMTTGAPGGMGAWR